MILSEMDAGRLSCTRIGGPLLFGRLWERLGIADVLADLLRGRGFDFAVERAVLIERARGETQLFVKEVTVNGARYVVCRNEAKAEKDRADRQAIVEGLEKQLRKGDKALIGNSAY